MKKKSLSAKKTIHSLIVRHLKNKKILKIFNSFESLLLSNVKQKKIAVAVSGGPDSLALAFLAKCISVIHKFEVKFFIVDHKLRENSSNEANDVKSFLKKFDINCQILKWHKIKPKSNIQSIARKNRYDLLTIACKKNNIQNLLLGHHSDDAYENFFIRLFRGSGLKGLTSFGEIFKEQNTGILYLRPLIKFEKKDLIYLTNKIFKFYINDPSNKNVHFQRSRIRELLKNLKKEGFDKKKFNLTIKNLKASNDSITFYVNKNIKSNSKFMKNRNAYFLKKRFFYESEEVIFRSFSYVIKHIGNKYYSSRGKSIISVINKIKSSKFQKVTLGGCIIEKINETILITKES